MTKPVHPPPEPVDVTEPVYLADTSVYVLRARHPLVRRRFESLLGEGRLATCQVITLEYLNNVPDPEGYQKLWEAMYAQLWIDVTSDAMDRALDVHRALAEKGDHLHFRLPDLIIAATAEVGGAALLHYDPAYDRIAEVTGQPMEWVVPQGSL